MALVGPAMVECAAAVPSPGVRVVRTPEEESFAVSSCGGCMCMDAGVVFRGKTFAINYKQSLEDSRFESVAIC